ncbi:MAG: SAP domain-containing protein [Candidatus Poseidoniales archaeon]|nr:SAP domain-containing protein [Candidatus Poseidoniales archaeon]
MVDENLLSQLYSARLDELREMAISHDMSKAGNVEQLRARLIDEVALSDHDLSWDSLQEMPNKKLGEMLGIFGVKRSGSIKEKRQRLWLHLNHDPKKLNPEAIADATRDQLHELCKALELPRSGSKQQLFARVAGVLSNHEGGWGKVKKSLRRGKAVPVVPTTSVTQEVQVQDDEAAELAAMIQASIDAVDVDELTNVLDEPDEPGPVDNEGIVESEIIITAPTDLTIDEGAGSAIIELEARIAELHSHIREFLLISREHDVNDVTAFVEDLGGQGFQVSHAMVRNRILAEITAMANRRDAESDASAQVPGSWRERKALRRLEECRPGLLDTLESILDSDGDDIALARVRFETAAAEAGLDLDLPGISGRVHGLFDLQLSLREAEEDVDPVTARRQRALEVLYRGTQDVSSDAMRTLQRFEEQIENFERIVETLVRRSEGQFGPVEHALLVRFLERRGWDVGHPEVRPRAIAAAGVLAAAMGYINPEDVPGLPTSISLDPDRVSDVVDSLRDLLVDMGRSAPTADSVAHGVSADDAEQAEEASSIGRVRGKLDQADELLSRLSRGFDAEASE